MFNIDPSVFGQTKFSWGWYGWGGALISFTLASLIALYILYSQGVTIRSTLWLVVSIAGWLLTLPSFLLGVDGMMFSTHPFAYKLSSNLLLALAILGLVGGLLSLVSLIAYLSRWGVHEEAGELEGLAEATQGLPETVGGLQTGIAPGEQVADVPVTQGVSWAESEETMIGGKVSVRSAEVSTDKTVMLRRKSRQRELAWLVQVTGTHLGRVYRLSKSTEIGRDPALNQIVVDDGEVSGIHAIIRLVDGKFVIQDRGSSNGTFVNGEEAVKQDLRDHDTIRVGGTEFVFLQVRAQG